MNNQYALGVPEEIIIKRMDNGFVVNMRTDGEITRSATGSVCTSNSASKHSAVFEHGEAPRTEDMLRNVVRVLEYIALMFDSYPSFGDDPMLKIYVELMDRTGATGL